MEKKKNDDDDLGTERVQLVQQVLTTDQASDHYAYAQAILQGSASASNPKRGLLQALGSASSPQRVARVAQMADIMDGMLSRVHQGIVLPYIDRVNVNMAGKPPPLRAYGSDATPNGYTTAATNAFSLTTIWSSEQTSASTTVTSLDRATHAGWRILAYLASRDAVTAGVNSDGALSAKRQAGVTFQANPAGPNASMVLSLVGQGVKGMISVAREVLTGKANRNATSTVPGSALTVVAWKKPSNATVYIRTHRGHKGIGRDQPRSHLPLTGASTALKDHWRRQTTGRASLHQALERTMTSQAAYLNSMDVTRNPLEQSRRLASVRTQVANLWASGGSLATLSTSSTPPAPVPNFTIPNNCFFLNDTTCTFNGGNCSLNGAQCFFNGSMCVANGVNPCFNCTLTGICQDCYILDQYAGYSLIFLTRVFQTYTNTAPQYWNNWNATYATYISLANYIQNVNAPVKLGNSDALQPWFPPLNGNWTDFFDDPLPKVGFGEIQDLLNATWDWFYNYVILPLTNPVTYSTSSVSVSLSAADAFISAPSYRIMNENGTGPLYTVSNPWVLMASTPETLALATARYQVELAAWTAARQSGQGLYRPKPIPPQYTSFGMIGPTIATVTGYVFKGVIMMGDLFTSGAFSVAISTSSKRSVQTTYTSLGQVLEAWVELFLTRYLLCYYTSQLDGTDQWAGLLVALIYVGGIAAAIALVIAQIPIINVLPAVGIGGSFLLPFIWIVYSTATGWGLFCGAGLAQPQALFTSWGINAVARIILPQCPWLGAGLVSSLAYNGSTCRSCDMWQNGTFHMLNPMDDLGFTNPLDVIVFPLHVLAPQVLITLGDPTQFSFPLNLLIASPLWQVRNHAVFPLLTSVSIRAGSRAGTG
jgi:hypothetical protein